MWSIFHGPIVDLTGAPLGLYLRQVAIERGEAVPELVAPKNCRLVEPVAVAGPTQGGPDA